MHKMSMHTQEAATTPTMYAGGFPEEELGDIFRIGLELDSYEGCSMSVTEEGLVLGVERIEDLVYGRSDVRYLTSTTGSLHTLFAYSLYERI